MEVEVGSHTWFVVPGVDGLKTGWAGHRVPWPQSWQLEIIVFVPERGLTTFTHFIKCFSARYKSFFLVAVRLLPQPYGTQTLGSSANLFSPVPALLLVQPWGCGDTGYHCREGWRKEPGRGQALPLLLRYLWFQVAVPSVQPRGVWLLS